MKRFFKFSVGLLFVFFAGTGMFFWKTSNDFQSPSLSPPVTIKAFVTSETDVLKLRANDLKQYATEHNYNTQIAFLINLKKHSGENRFYVYDLKNNAVLQKGLVTHGRCNQQWLEGRKYSNEKGCGCSSLGKYKIGKSYYGRFGLAYKLHGLDSTNSNAYERFVVLHSHQCVPENEVTPEPICQSDGCPTVSPHLLQYLKPVLNKSKKPVLLWMYEE